MKKRCNLTLEERHKLSNLLMSTDVGINLLYNYIQDREECYDMMELTIHLKKASDDLMEMFKEFRK